MNIKSTRTGIVNTVKPYGRKILAENTSFSMNTRITGHNNNVCCIGGSGHGKTTGFVEPNLEYCVNSEERHSLIIADTKGQLSRRYGKLFSERGYKVSILNLADPENSCGYNPLDYIRFHKDGSVYEQDILTIANIIQSKNSDKEPYWDHASAGYIAFLIGYIFDSQLPEEDRNLITVNRLHHAFLQPNGQLTFKEWAESHPDTFTARKFAEVDFLAASEKTFSCVLSFASIALQCLAFSEARNLFANPSGSLCLEEIGKCPTVLFVNSSDTDYTYTKISALFYTQLFQVLTNEADASGGSCKVPVDIYMDDFCSSAAAIKDFDKITSVIRSRDISVNIMIQSIAQLENMYGKSSATTIIDNCDTILYMGGNSPETADFLSIRVCRTPEEILHDLPRNKMWIISSGEKARKVDQILPGRSHVYTFTEPEAAEETPEMLIG